MNCMKSIQSQVACRVLSMGTKFSRISSNRSFLDFGYCLWRVQLLLEFLNFLITHCDLLLPAFVSFCFNCFLSQRARNQSSRVNYEDSCSKSVTKRLSHTYELFVSCKDATDECSCSYKLICYNTQHANG